MPFPFDGEQTIGILSNATRRRGGSILPIVPEQKPQDPPPNPLDLSRGDIDDEKFWEWYFNTYHGPFAEPIDIVYYNWLNKDPLNGDPRGGGKSPVFGIEPFVRHTLSLSTQPGFIPRVPDDGRNTSAWNRLTKKEKEELLKRMLETKKLQEERDKNLCNELGNYMFVVPLQCDDDVWKFRDENKRTLEISSEVEWNTWRNDSREWLKLKRKIELFANIYAQKFGTKLQKELVEVLTFFDVFQDAIEPSSPLGYSYECFKLVQKYLRDMITLMELDCAINAAENWLTNHGLDYFPCEKNQSDYLSLKNIRFNLAESIKTQGEFDCTNLA